MLRVSSAALLTVVALLAFGALDLGATRVSASPGTAAGSRDRKDLCRRARDWLRDVGPGGPLARPLARVADVVRDGLAKLETAGLDSASVYQEIGSLREFTTTITDDGRTLRYRALTQELALAAANDGATSGVQRQALESARQFFEQLHAVAMMSRTLSPDLTVFRLRLILDEWDGAATHGAEALPALPAAVGPWIDEVLCVTATSSGGASEEL
eukprot:CAMPEP_0174846936 /NCGR_PEP_ID=MMETSP1114-20130205/12605_1 /TAXON_ID=312471 /ORGANISM="Neobodo designis, Strain CCAP 1951/1" /LENGTH=213 /DNA_ID=CAMNT_0016081207 /DNA_START=50 /DNA_END=691 /DNA_ORIENTATION=+